MIDERVDKYSVQFGSVQSLSHVRLFATPWIAARQASLSITNSRSSLRLTSIESVMPSSHLILCRPLLLLPPIPPSIRVFSNESTLHMRWPKYWSFCFSINSFQRNTRADLLQNGLVGSPCSPRDSQEPWYTYDPIYGGKVRPHLLITAHSFRNEDYKFSPLRKTEQAVRS